MSRSRRKTPIIGNCTAESEKDFKTAEHRRERAAVRTALRADEDAPNPKAFGNPWAGPKDGRHYLGGGYEKLMRK